MSTLSSVTICYIGRVGYIYSLKCVGSPFNLIHKNIHCSALQHGRHLPLVQRRNRVQSNDKVIASDNQEKSFLSKLLSVKSNTDDGEQIIETPFGDIRFDVQNKPSYKPEITARQKTPTSEHGHSIESVQFEQDNDQMSCKNNNWSDAIASQREKETVDMGDGRKRTNLVANIEKPKNRDQNFFDEQYFENLDVSKVKEEESRLTEAESQLSDLDISEVKKYQKSRLTEADSRLTTDSNFFEEHYFSEYTIQDNLTEPPFSTTSNNCIPDDTNNRKLGANSRPKFLTDTLPKSVSITPQDNVNFFDEQYFPTGNYNETIRSEKSASQDLHDSQHKQIDRKMECITQDEITRKKAFEKTSNETCDYSHKYLQTPKGEAVSLPNQGSKDVKDHEIIKKKQSAFDVVRDIRKQKNEGGKEDGASNKMTKKQIDANPWAKTWDGKVDSRGFRILTNQVPDFTNHLEEDVVHLLKKRIIYEDDDMVAVDKPYGLPSHGGPGVHHSVGRVLKPLGQKIHRSLETLYLVHRLDKETTGVMLLAKNALMAKRLGEMFKKRQVIKKYWVLTKGVPVPDEGTIDIPMTEGTVDGKYRMTLRPHYPKEMKTMHRATRWRPREKGHEAITNFRVLAQYMSAALVECQPESGVKHQIRCHLAFALNTPILGDHKYSHLAKLAPQKLHPDILQRLGIRQSKVRTLPMHLHAKTVILPEFKDGRNLFINAKLPKYFKQNMKWLKIKEPE